MRISRRCSAGLVYPVASSQNGLYKIVASLIIIKFSHVFLAWKFGAQFGISSIFLLFTVLVAQQCRFSWSWMDGWMGEVHVVGAILYFFFAKQTLSQQQG